MKKITRISVLIALSIVLSIFESLIPIFNIPGIKIGLANIIVLTVLYIYGFKEAFTLSILRVLFIGILRTGLGINFYFSLSGAILSILFMVLAKKTKLSIIGVSIVGSIMHTVGQMVIAISIFNNINLIYYLPYMIVFSIITGIVIGKLSKENIKFFENNL